MNNRTPASTIYARIYMMMSPMIIVLMILAGPFAIPVLIGALISITIVIGFAKIFTNLFVQILDPQGYKQRIAAGGDPYLDSMGWPFNMDSQETRDMGIAANVNCPACHLPLALHNNSVQYYTQCPCGVTWYDNQWWAWDGSDWVQYKFVQPTQMTPESSKKREVRKSWTGTKIGRG